MRTSNSSLTEAPSAPDFGAENGQKSCVNVVSDNVDINKALDKDGVAEVYLVLRVNRWCRDYGLSEGRSLDLRTAGEDGKAWDFSCEAARARAKKLLRKTKPKLFRALCAPISHS